MWWFNRDNDNLWNATCLCRGTVSPAKCRCGHLYFNTEFCDDSAKDWRESTQIKRKEGTEETQEE